MCVLPEENNKHDPYILFGLSEYGAKVHTLLTVQSRAFLLHGELPIPQVGCIEECHYHHTIGVILFFGCTYVTFCFYTLCTSPCPCTSQSLNSYSHTCKSYKYCASALAPSFQNLESHQIFVFQLSMDKFLAPDGKQN